MITVPVHRVPGRSCKAKGRAKAKVVAEARIDDGFARLLQYFWTIHDGYAVRGAGGRTIFMHHDVAGRITGLDVSHENGDKLDNRCANLRHVSRSTNMLNPNDPVSRARRSCPYRGVCRDDKSRPLAKPWRGKVTVNGKIHQTARTATAEEARDALRGLRISLGLKDAGVDHA